MAQAAFGKLTSWDDAVPAGGGDFFNTKEDKEYHLRFLTDIPFEYPVHWLELDGGKKLKLKCAGRGCVLCAAGHEAKVTFVANVLDRQTGRVQIYEFGRQIFDQLKGYAKNAKWGDIRKYDVCIDKKKNRKPNVYMVQAEPPLFPLTDDEKATAMEFIKDRGDLNKLAAPMTNDEIRKKLAEVGASNLAGPSASASFSGAVSMTEPSTDNADFKFPDFEE